MTEEWKAAIRAAMQAGFKKSSTGFALIIWENLALMAKPFVVMVHNRPSDDKPIAFGLAGGGGEPEDAGLVAQTSFGETKRELNLIPLNDNQWYKEPLIRVHKYILNGPDGKIFSQVFCEWGRTPAPEEFYRRKMDKMHPKRLSIIRDDVGIILLQTNFGGSPLEAMLLKRKEQMIREEKITQEEIDRFGFWTFFENLKADGYDLESLGIEEMVKIPDAPPTVEEREIDGVGIFPTNLFTDPRKPGPFDELVEYFCGSRPKKSDYTDARDWNRAMDEYSETKGYVSIYWSHRDWVHKALVILGLMEPDQDPLPDPIVQFWNNLGSLESSESD